MLGQPNNNRVYQLRAYITSAATVNLGVKGKWLFLWWLHPFLVVDYKFNNARSQTSTRSSSEAFKKSMRLIKPTNENLIIKKINETNFFGFCPNFLGDFFGGFCPNFFGCWFSKTLFVYGLVGMFVANRLSCFLFSAVYRHTDRHFVRHVFAQRTPKQILTQKSQIWIFFTISLVFSL